MPSGDICTANMGTPWPLSYGHFRATGMRVIDYSVPAAAATPQPANMQIGVWDLGEGELDGCNALWVGGALQFAYDSNGNLMGRSLLGVTPSGFGTDTIVTTPTLNSFSFHTGCDAPLGSTPGNSETAQVIDPVLGPIGNLITRLCYSRRAYYTIGWTPATSDNSAMAPVADFRGMRCRIFDGSGKQIAYRFTTNPMWHFVDLWLRRAIKPDYALPQGGLPDALTADEASRFNWPYIFDCAQYCDELLANGLPRFSGSYVFASGSTLASMLEQVLLCCRGYWYEYAGKICVAIDRPRASTFIVSARHLASSSIERDDSQVSQGANRYIGRFLELGLPAMAAISTISSTPGTGGASALVQIDTVNPNPCAVGDVISVGGVDPSTLDAAYTVSAIPSGTPREIDCSVSTAAAVSGTGGFIGYIQSRFSQRTPEINHQQHQLAQGHIFPPNVAGLRLKRIKVTYDFASMTYDQAMRLLQYEVYRDLGIDWLNQNMLLRTFGDISLLGSPYLPPWQVTLSLFSESVDASMRALKAQQPGDVITLDPSVFFELAGDYEIMAKNISHFQQEVQNSTGGNFTAAPARSGAMNTGTDQGSGILQLTLRSFNSSPAIFTDVSVDRNSSFATVPGQLPYAGVGTGAGSGSGFTLTSGTVSLTTVWQDVPANAAVSTVAWTAINLHVPPGITLHYPAGRFDNVVSDGSGNSWCLYIDDPTLSGDSSSVKLTQGGDPAPGVGIFIISRWSNLPDMPVNSTDQPDILYP